MRVFFYLGGGAGLSFRAMLQTVQRLQQGDTVMVLTMMQALGVMVAAHRMVPLGLLHLCTLCLTAFT